MRPVSEIVEKSGRFQQDDDAALLVNSSIKSGPGSFIRRARRRRSGSFFLFWPFWRASWLEPACWPTSGTGGHRAIGSRHNRGPSNAMSPDVVSRRLTTGFVLHAIRVTWTSACPSLHGRRSNPAGLSRRECYSGAPPGSAPCVRTGVRGLLRPGRSWGNVLGRSTTPGSGSRGRLPATRPLHPQELWQVTTSIRPWPGVRCTAPWP